MAGSVNGACMVVYNLACRCEGGLRTCVISASNAEFVTDPCVHTHKYLQVNYRCLQPAATGNFTRGGSE